MLSSRRIAVEGNHTKDDYDWTPASLVTPALAAEYWVVKDAATQTRSVVEQHQKPASSPNTSVIGRGHQTRDAAENVESTTVGCDGQD
jgi:hypothetical protein